MYAEDARKKFWETLRNKLKEKNDPFYFSEHKQWAVINRENAYSYHQPCVAMDFLWSKKILRINVYIENNIALYEILKSHKEEIEHQLGFNCIWKETENLKMLKKHKFDGLYARRIEINLDFNFSFSELAERAIPITEKFVKVFRCYVKC